MVTVYLIIAQKILVVNRIKLLTFNSFYDRIGYTNKEGLTMFMVYIGYNGKIAKQEIREARNLESAKQSALFDFIAENNIGFIEMANVETQGYKI